jgi:predicted nucleic acid-binding Zn ribbon protein
MQDADRDVECPKCGARDVKRLLSTFAPQMGSSGSHPGELAPCGQPASACSSGRCGRG